MSEGGPVVAAGAVVWRQSEDGLEVCLVHRPRYDDWSLPKGKLDPGEHVLAGAVREVREETGHRVALGRPLPGQRYLAEGRPKRVYYWAAEADPAAAPLESTAEIDEVAFLPVERALRALTHDRDAETVAALADGPVRTGSLVLLRHADSVNRDEWPGADGLRPLSPDGIEEAERLVAPLAALGVTRVVSSSAVRCVDTVSPYARRHGLDIELEPLLTEDGHAMLGDRVQALVQKYLAEGDRTVVCTHRPVLPTLVEAVSQHTGLPAPEQSLPPAGFHVVHHYDGKVTDIETHRV